MPPVVSKQKANAATTTKPPIPTSKPGSGSVLDRIAPIGFSADDGIKILIYGRSGTGKTTLWATFPGPILAMVCSGGKKPGELRSIDTKEYREKISQVVVEKTEEIPQLLEHVTRSGRFRTVVLDHASGLSDLTLKEILNLDELPAQKTWGLASQQQYGQLGIKCKECFRSLLSLDTNVVIVAQERNFNEDSAASSDILKPVIGAALTPSVVGWLNPACDYVVQTFIRPKMDELVTKIGTETIKTQQRGKGVEYCLRTEPHDVFTTKFRVPRGRVLPSEIVDPTYEKIIRLIRG